ncbi:MAG: hypothetical protein OXG27_08885, partial [Chloroflexi bacterium]|nr:hypothetical protein [Chloroflexota bacterium]
GKQVAPGSRRQVTALRFSPHCDYVAPPCFCGAGHILAGPDSRVRCTNAGCRARPEHCPICQWGALVERHGPHGPFWGWSRFSADPSCGFTDNRRTSAAAPGRARDRVRP